MDKVTLIKQLALANALKFKGKANSKALIGGLIKEMPEVKQDMQATMKEINDITAEINALSLEEQKEFLLTLDPEHEKKQAAAKEERKAKANELPELPNAVDGKVVTRIPPEPSKYAHLGHAMSFLINYLYAKKYKGKCLLRFDDTNPGKATTEFLEAIKEDVTGYLGCKVDETIIASDHMEKYYGYAKQLIEQGHAYACNCTDVSDKRRAGEDCEHRSQTQEETLTHWQAMQAGTSDMVLRLKIDMQHKNAVMRDPVIFRVVNEPHYRTHEKYKAWPMYDFETAIEEGLCGVTHVLRSNEFDQRIELQNYIAALFDFPEVTYKHYGRYNVTGATTQGREIRALIENGDYIGWDDPRLVTLKALHRRGILPEAFTLLAKKIGLSKTQTNLDFGVIAAVNRNLLDEQAKRFFAVANPVTVSVSGIPEGTTQFDLSFHPHGKKGERPLPVTKEYFIEKKDNDAMKPGQIVRFIDAMNVKKIDDTSYAFVSFAYEDYQSQENTAGLIHFIPKNGDELKAAILWDDAKERSLLVEQNGSHLKPGDIIQFERFCFARVDHVKEDGTLGFWYAHD